MRERDPREELLGFLDDLLIIGRPVILDDGRDSGFVDCRLYKARIKQIIQIVMDNVPAQETIP